LASSAEGCSGALANGEGLGCAGAADGVEEGDDTAPPGGSPCDIVVRRVASSGAGAVLAGTVSGGGVTVVSGEAVAAAEGVVRAGARSGGRDVVRAECTGA
jgi:hypothetical protein